MNTSKQYDIVIIGAGASGSALAYTLAAYTDAQKIALVEKYQQPGQVNSKAVNNSQTLHVGDIETNYSIDKVRQVQPASMMVYHYAQSLPVAERDSILFPVSKMVLGVGRSDVATLTKRFDDLKPLFPEIKKLDAEAIARVEPAVMAGRDPREPVVALFSEHGHAVNFEALAVSFVRRAKILKSGLATYFGNKVQRITKTTDGYSLELSDGTAISGRIVVVDADSYSLLFAKQLGYGKEYSLIPIAGTFYFTKPLLNGKVYTVQEPKLPFAAVHGDPDVVTKGKTRWGPTARFHPVLESRNIATSFDYLRSSGLNRAQTWISFFKILLDPVRFLYLLENMLYELPWVGTLMFIKHVKKIVPTITYKDVEKAKGFGGMRLQRVDTVKGELQLGEGKIIGDNILFNMTPSPGASVSLYNAMRDVEQITVFAKWRIHFNKEKMLADLMPTPTKAVGSPSLPTSYPS